MSNKQNHGIFGNYMSPYSSSDQPLNVPGYSGGNFSSLSPYLNVDPSYLNQSGPEFLFPEGTSRHRGRFELAFSQIGGSVMAGSLFGGVRGVFNGLKESSAAGLTGGVRRTQLLNVITKSGSTYANSLGVLAVMYSGVGVLLSSVRGTDDDANTIVAATTTGLLFKSSAGLRRCAVGGVMGLSLGVAYCLWARGDRFQNGYENRS